MKPPGICLKGHIRRYMWETTINFFTFRPMYTAIQEDCRNGKTRSKNMNGQVIKTTSVKIVRVNYSLWIPQNFLMRNLEKYCLKISKSCQTLGVGQCWTRCWTKHLGAGVRMNPLDELARRKLHEVGGAHVAPVPFRHEEIVLPFGERVGDVP